MASEPDLILHNGKVTTLDRSGDYSDFDEGELPPPMPDWSPVRNLDGHRPRGETVAKSEQGLRRQAALACDCGHNCNIHGHDHAGAWSSRLPVGDPRSFWGVLGCSCWAV